MNPASPSARAIVIGAERSEQLAKNYLRFLVERIVVQGNSLEIHGKADASVALLAASPDSLTQPLQSTRKFLLP